MKVILLSLFVALLVVGCGEEHKYTPHGDQDQLRDTTEEYIPITNQEAGEIINNIVRKKLGIKSGDLNKTDWEKVLILNLSPRKETEKGSYAYTYPELKKHRSICWDETGLKELTKLNQLKGLRLRGCDKITASGVRELAKLKKLTHLSLEGTLVTIDGLKQLANLNALTSLNLWGSEITDEGINEVAKLKQLKKLNLNNNHFTDRGLREIVKLTQLTSFTQSSDKVTEAGIDELKKALPNCKIYYHSGTWSWSF